MRLSLVMVILLPLFAASTSNIQTSSIAEARPSTSSVRNGKMLSRQPEPLVLHHEQWQQRKVMLQPNTSLSSPLATFVPFPLSPSAFENAAIANDQAGWDDHADAACMLALNALNGFTSNPSGLSTCYNIRTWDNETGAFEADLRLYRVSLSLDEWAKPDTSRTRLEVLYARAKVSMSNNQRMMRDIAEIPSQGWQQGDARESYRLRACGVPPRKIMQLVLLGQFNNFAVAEFADENALRSLLSPNITVTGKTLNGHLLATQLSINDASFIAGMIVKNSTIDIPISESLMSTDGVIRRAKILTRLAVGLLIAGVCVLLLVVFVGYKTLIRTHAKSAYDFKEKIESTVHPKSKLRPLILVDRNRR